MLRAQQDSLQRVPHADPAVTILQPLIGTLRLTPEQIGATQMGDLASEDPAAPGVAFYVATGRGTGASVVARIGSASNARGPQAFDAGHFTLFLRRIDGGGFAGEWRSSPGTGGKPQTDSGGHFCAVRVEQ